MLDIFKLTLVWFLFSKMLDNTIKDIIFYFLLPTLMGSGVVVTRSLQLLETK